MPGRWPHHRSRTAAQAQAQADAAGAGMPGPSRALQPPASQRTTCSSAFRAQVLARRQRPVARSNRRMMRRPWLGTIRLPAISPPDMSNHSQGVMRLHAARSGNRQAWCAAQAPRWTASQPRSLPAHHIHPPALAQHTPSPQQHNAARHHPPSFNSSTHTHHARSARPTCRRTPPAGRPAAPAGRAPAPRR